MTDSDWRPTLEPSHGQSKFHALAVAIRRAVRIGELVPGERLPPVRELAQRLGVTPGTVARAYQIAALDGGLESTVGRGSFVRAVPLSRLETMQTERATGAAVDLRAAYVPDVGQVAAVRMAMRTAMMGLGTEILSYPFPDRDIGFRSSAMKWLGDFRAGPYGPDDLVLTLGAQAAIMLSLKLNLQNHRPNVLTEDLGYAGFRHATGLVRGRLVPLPTDDRGLEPRALEAAAAEGQAAVICITPSAHNPTMVRMDAERRAAIVEIARRHDLQVIEDHALCGPPSPSADEALRALAPERCWTITSMSKSFAPGIRGAVMICPAGMGPAARSGEQHTQFGLPYTHNAMIGALMEGDARRFARRVQAQYDARLQIAVEILDGTHINWVPSAPYVWLNLPRRWQAAEFAAYAAARGVLIRPTEDFWPVGRGVEIAPAIRPAPQGVRIAMSGQTSLLQFEAAMRILRRLHDAAPR